MDEYTRRNNSNPAAWDALGSKAHIRMHKNHVRWAKGYPTTLPSFVPVDNLEALQKWPVDWTVGEAMLMETFFDNVVTAAKIEAETGMLPGAHFPYVSHAEFADYVVRTTRKYA
jgi:hypothetical protein